LVLASVSFLICSRATSAEIYALAAIPVELDSTFD
jgi:hypothetical protein